MKLAPFAIAGGAGIVAPCKQFATVAEIASAYRLPLLSAAFGGTGADFAFSDARFFDRA